MFGRGAAGAGAGVVTGVGVGDGLGRGAGAAEAGGGVEPALLPPPPQPDVASAPATMVEPRNMFLRFIGRMMRIIEVRHARQSRNNPHP